MSDDAYLVDVNAIRRAFPTGTEPPSLLMDFAAWLDGRPWGSVGCFGLDGKFSDHAPIFDGSPLRTKFALFLRLPDGSLVGYWHGVPGDGAPPIVRPMAMMARAKADSTPVEAGEQELTVNLSVVFELN